MPTQALITVYCVPHCGHARAVLDLLQRRGLRYEQRTLTPDAAAEVISMYHLYGSPILVINGEVVTGTEPILARVEMLVAGR